MKIALAYSSKCGLLNEYRRRFSNSVQPDSEDIFAEGDTPATIQAVVDAIMENGHEVFGIEADIGIESNLEKIKPDLVFNIAEGLFGEFRESYVPMICEKLSYRYTGSGPLSLGICLHKGRCKEILTANGIANADFRIFRMGSPLNFEGFRFPGIVKPIAEGSSKGIFDNSVVENELEAKLLIQSALKKYHQPMILESFLEGDEYTVAMIGNGADLEILPIVGLDFSKLPKHAKKLYSYEAKWIWDTPEEPLQIFQCPAPMNIQKKEAIEQLVRRTFDVLEMRDWGRMDVRLDHRGVPHIIEVNPIPGILPDPKENSCFPKAGRSAGYTYPQLFQKVIESAEKRFSQEIQ